LKITDFDISRQAFVYGAIHMLSNHLQILGDRIDPTISSKQWFLLVVVSKFKEAPPNVSDVADVLCTSRQNVKKMANILEKRGFLNMKTDKNDLRSTQLFLTEKCSNYFKSREQKETEYIERIFSGIDNNALELLCNELKKLLENTDKLLENDINAES